MLRLIDFTSVFNLVKEYVPVSQSATIDTSKGTREDDFRVELPIASRQILAESTSAQNGVSQSQTINTSQAGPSIESTSDLQHQEEVGSLSAEANTQETAIPNWIWVEAMQEELLQFERQGVWKTCPLPKGKYAIGTKWVFRNKKDDKGVVIKNKARLVLDLIDELGAKESSLLNIVLKVIIAHLMESHLFFDFS
ncbi:hypothetical protein E3N88_09504 [Mikania micrantha]|uniref:Reverse transcriptase Ty1/copia-type domain-containing protein n=1 Tax=Mikania micrantha TaxID=192012 RepID=A0A5N6PK54_9ASTR|nr:hypothetical protein E3N88_09504 [Mikania micrantha]